MKPYYQDKWVTIYHGDCMEVLPMLECKVDLIVTDPPYFLPASHYQTRTQFSRNFADLGILEYFFRNCFAELDKITKDNAILYIFCDGQSYPLFYYHLYPFCKSVRPLIWDKLTSINGYSWRHQHEIIIFAEKPQAKPVPSGDGDILKCRAVPIDDREHGAQKPTGLIELLIAKSSIESSITLDPFAGVGSTGLAAKRLNRQSILIDTSAEYCEIAARRCSQEVMDFTSQKA